MPKNLPIVALVGPPNAGKSTLLNKIVKEQAAVTSEIAGTTRDRQYAATSFDGVDFLLVDTAGLDLSAKGELEENIQKQIETAVAEADLIVMVVDGKQPPSALDQNVLKKFRKIKKPKMLAVNKTDSPQQRDSTTAAFQKLGVKPIFAISAATGRGIGDMLEEIAATLSSSGRGAPSLKEGAPLDTPHSINVSLVGKPNVGKSSLFNKILNDERAVVSSVPGTTRTAIDENIQIAGVNYTFIDTAGLKKKEHRQAKPDIFSGFQTFKSIRRSDVCLFVIDATEPITFQDQRIAQEILKMQKGCIILANKFDIFKGKEQQLKDYISHHFPFLWMCPVFFVSAANGKGLSEALEAIQPIFDRRNKKISDQELSEFLMKILKQQPPKRLWDQKNPKVFSLRQTASNPPTFDLLVNFPAAIAHHFKNFLENSIVKKLDFWGTPIKLHLTRKIGR